MFSLKVCLGIFLGTFSGISLILNILVLVAVFRLAFVQRKNPVYIIAFFNIFSDVLQMSMTTFYLSPSIITSSFLVGSQKKEKWTLAFGSAFMFFWYFETITQVIMALNRFVIICLQKHKMFTFFSTCAVFVILIPMCLLIMYISQYANPCCSFVFDHEYLSYSYYQLENVPNYSDKFDLPLNAASSVISVSCYAMIFWTVHQSNMCPGIGQQHQMRRSKDIRYAIQFSCLLIFYIFVWVLFRLLPVILANRHVEWFILVPTFYTINCTSNSMVYICFNCEVQNNLLPKRMLSILESLGLATISKTQPMYVNSQFSVSNPSRMTSVNAGTVASVSARFTPKRTPGPFRSIGLNQANMMR